MSVCVDRDVRHFVALLHGMKVCEQNLQGCRGYGDSHGDSHGYAYGMGMGTVINLHGLIGILRGFFGSHSNFCRPPRCIKWS